LIKENQYTTNNSKFRYQGRATPLLLSNTQAKIERSTGLSTFGKSFLPNPSPPNQTLVA